VRAEDLCSAGSFSSSLLLYYRILHRSCEPLERPESIRLVFPHLIQHSNSYLSFLFSSLIGTLSTDTSKPFVYIIIVRCHINAVKLNCCAYWLPLCNVAMLLTHVVDISHDNSKSVCHSRLLHRYLEKQEPVSAEFPSDWIGTRGDTCAYVNYGFRGIGDDDDDSLIVCDPIGL